MNKTMTTFRELPYERPDVKKIKKEITRYLRLFNDAKTFEDADSAFLGLMDMLESCFTLSTIASIRNTMNTKDEFYDGEVRFFNKETAKLMLTLKKGIKSFLTSPFRPQFEEKYGSHLFKQCETEINMVNLLTILPTIKEGNLSTEYSKTAATCSVEFMGEKCNFYGLLRHMQSTDREERRAAFEEWAKLYEGISGKLDEIYGKLVKTRCTKAKRLGFSSYIDYIYPSRGRYDYDAKRVAEFREAVRTYITPFCDEMFKEQAERLGLEKLEWYDEGLCFPEGNALPIGTPEELTEKALEMYKEMSPETGEYFSFMREH